MKKKTEKKSNAPIHRIRIGAVSGSVFLNTTKDGTQFPSAVISRSYKDGDAFRESNSYGAKHLAQLVDVVANLRAWLDANHADAAK